LKLCECGCGQPTEISKINRSDRGWVKGQPKRYIQGHVKKNIPKYKVICQKCGKEYEVIKSKLGRTKYCSHACQVSNPRKKIHKLNDIVMWDGYYAIYLPDHPKANISGVVMLHNCIMELHLGKAIPEGFIVHHIDGNKLNNHILNLVLVTPSVHGKIHATDKRKGLAKYHEIRRSNS
jgi:predicted nucleic acid-binding Zn ribbon protein